MHLSPVFACINQHHFSCAFNHGAHGTSPRTFVDIRSHVVFDRNLWKAIFTSMEQSVVVFFGTFYEKKPINKSHSLVRPRISFANWQPFSYSEPNIVFSSCLLLVLKAIRAQATMPYLRPLTAIAFRAFSSKSVYWHQVLNPKQRRSCLKKSTISVKKSTPEMKS